MSDQNKMKLREIISKLKKSDSLSEYENIIAHYFIQLINFQHELLKKEVDIVNFCKICNNYLVDKEIIYDSKNFKIQIIYKDNDLNYIYNNDNTTIKLQNLSSGEKQIVSIFSHILLSEMGSFFLLIDEPELSLSVEWQKEFLLDIYNTKSCHGIFAVTHSPFICDNKLMSFARGINNFGVNHG